jgi:hypothetical protein
LELAATHCVLDLFVLVFCGCRVPTALLYL